MGIDHPGLPCEVEVPAAIRDCLVQDLGDSGLQ
jgi:hypothetical protein